MNNWIYREGLQVRNITVISDMPEGAVGIVYKITNLKDNKFYIGKKILQNTNTLKLGKKEKIRLADEMVGKGRRPSKKTVIKESNWLSYYGSSKPLLEDIKELGEDNFLREILCFAFSKKQMSYLEIKYQILNKCLELPDLTYNGNILGKYFPADLIND